MTKSETPAAATDIRAEETVRAILADLLGLPFEQVAAMTPQTELFGALPELDSMAVAGLLTELEDRLDIIIDDEDVDAELFETFGSLVSFTQKKLAH